MAQDRYNLGRHFVYWYVEDLIEAYEKRNVVVHVLNLNFKEPLKSIVVLERKELR